MQCIDRIQARNEKKIRKKSKEGDFFAALALPHSFSHFFNFILMYSGSRVCVFSLTPAYFLLDFNIQAAHFEKLDEEGESEREAKCYENENKIRMRVYFCSFSFTLLIWACVRWWNRI